MNTAEYDDLNERINGLQAQIECQFKELGSQINKLATSVASVSSASQEVPTKRKIDWTKIPIDTLIEVKDVEEGDWTKRYYAGKPNTAFGHGTTSLTVDEGDVMHGGYARLCEDLNWKAWFGGECPLPEGVKVAVIVRQGDKPLVGSCGLFRWVHSNQPGLKCQDIIAYRVLGYAEGWE